MCKWKDKNNKIEEREKKFRDRRVRRVAKKRGQSKFKIKMFLFKCVSKKIHGTAQ